MPDDLYFLHVVASGFEALRVLATEKTVRADTRSLSLVSME